MRFVDAIAYAPAAALIADIIYFGGLVCWMRYRKGQV